MKLDFPKLIEVPAQPTLRMFLKRLPAPPNVWPTGYKVWQLAEDWEDVPKGFMTDLSSIPDLLWPILPPDGLWRPASVKHDWRYAGKLGPRLEADDEYYNTCIEYGVDKGVAGLMYRNIRLFGWRAWNKSTGIPDVRELYYDTAD